jgi:hypothetical protein
MVRSVEQLLHQPGRHRAITNNGDWLLRQGNPRRGQLGVLNAHDHGKIRSMQTDEILTLLILERDKLSRAIEALQGPIRRRGRPPRNSVNGAKPTAAFEPAQPAKKKRRKFTAAQRKQQAERMKAYWSAKKKVAKPQSKAASKQKKTAKAG